MISKIIVTEKEIKVVSVGIAGPAGAPALGKYHLQQLSQIDINNGFITVSEIALKLEKENIVVCLSNIGLLLEFGVDYTIDVDGKIIWTGYALEGQLVVGDEIKIFY